MEFMFKINMIPDTIDTPDRINIVSKFNIHFPTQRDADESSSEHNIELAASIDRIQESVCNNQTNFDDNSDFINL